MAETSLYMFWFRFWFHSRDVPCTPSCFFFFFFFFLPRPGLRMFCARSPVHYLSVYSILGSLIMQSLTATATSAMAVKACVIILCLFLRCCLQKVTLKQQREIATFCIFERKWTIREQFLKFVFGNLTLSYIFCSGYLWRYRQITNWMILNSREIRWLNIKSSFNRLLLKLLFATWAASVCLYFWPSVCSVA